MNPAIITASAPPTSPRVAIFPRRALPSGVNGAGSSASGMPSLSSSVSAAFPVPSPSVSRDSVGSLGKRSRESSTPSLSSSGSTVSSAPSPSLSRSDRASTVTVSGEFSPVWLIETLAETAAPASAVERCSAIDILSAGRSDWLKRFVVSGPSITTSVIDTSTSPGLLSSTAPEAVVNSATTPRSTVSRESDSSLDRSRSASRCTSGSATSNGLSASSVSGRTR